MQLTLLKHIVTSIAGHSSAGVVDVLYGKKNVSEAIIAKKLRLTINQTRNILYRLADEGLVSFIRKKNSKKGGWYDYFWTLNSGKGLLKFRERLMKNIEQLKNQRVYRAAGRFFYCPSCQIEFSEEQALTHNYTCSECGNVLTLKDIRAEVVQLDKDIAKLQSVLVTVNQEANIISNQEKKAHERRVKAAQRKQAKLRAVRQKIARRARKNKKSLLYVRKSSLIKHSHKKQTHKKSGRS